MITLSQSLTKAFDEGGKGTPLTRKSSPLYIRDPQKKLLLGQQCQKISPNSMKKNYTPDLSNLK